MPPISIDTTNPFSSVDPSTIDFPDKGPQLENTYRQVIDVDPEQAGQVVNLSSKLGESPSFVAENLDAVKKADAAPASDYFKDVEARYPVTTKFLAQPQQMAVAKDDIPNVVEHENLFQSASDMLQAANPFSFAVKMGQTLTPETIRAAWGAGMSALHAGSLQEERDFLESSKIFGGNNDAASPISFAMNRFLGRGDGMSVDERIASLDDQLAQIETARPKSYLGRSAYSAIEMTPWIRGGFERGMSVALPAAGLSTAVLGPEAAPIGAAVGMEMGRESYNYFRMVGALRTQLRGYRDANGKPLSDEVINNTAMFGGFAAAAVGPELSSILEKVTPFAGNLTGKVETAALEKLGLGPALARMGKSMAKLGAEGAGVMTAITGANMAAGEIAKTVSGQPFEHLTPSQAIQQLSTAALEAFGTFSIMGVPNLSLGFGGDVLRASKAAEDTANLHAAISSAAERSKVLDRLPEGYQHAFGEMAKSNDVASVFMPAQDFERYF